MTKPLSILDQIDVQGERLAKAESDLYDLTTALSRAFDGTAKLDENGKYVFVNDLYAANFGYTTKNLQGLSWETTTIASDHTAMRAAIEYCKIHGRAEIEAKGLQKDGTIFWKKVGLVRIPPETNKPYSGYYAFVRDITDSKRWATELQHSEQRFSTLVRANSSIVFVCDMHGFLSEEQPSWTAFTGQSYEEYKGMGWFEAVHEDDKLRVSEAWTSAVLNARLYEIEYRLKRADGQYRDMFVRSAPVLEEDGSVREWIGSCEDVTDAKQFKQRFQVLTNAMPQLVWTTDSDGMILYRNQQWYDYTGTSDKDTQNAIHPDDLVWVTPLWKRAIVERNSSYEAEMRLRRHDGEYEWFLVRGTPVFATDGVFLYWIGTCTNINTQHLATAALLLSQTRLQAILDAALDAIISMDQAGLVIEWNPSCERIFGWTRKEAMGCDLSTLIIPEELREQHTQGLLHYLETGEEKILGRRLELPAIHKDGTKISTELTILPARADNVLLFTAYVRDITEKKRNEQIQKLRDRMREAETTGLVITDSSLKDEPIIYCNSTFEQLTGYGQAEIIGNNCRFLQGPNTDAASVKKLRDAIKSRKPCQVRILNYRKNGTTFWNDLTISPVLDDKGDCTNFIGVQYVVEDVESIETPPTPYDTESTTHEPT